MNSSAKFLNTVARSWALRHIDYSQGKQERMNTENRGVQGGLLQASWWGQVKPEPRGCDTQLTATSFLPTCLSPYSVPDICRGIVWIWTPDLCDLIKLKMWFGGILRGGKSAFYLNLCAFYLLYLNIFKIPAMPFTISLDKVLNFSTSNS